MYRFEAELWRWTGEQSWHFVTVPAETSDDIDARTAHTPRRGFGSVRVRVTIGGSTWTTSVFPSNEFEAYLLPVKARIRTKEAVSHGDLITVVLELLESG